MSFQQITLVGNLGRDPEMRYTPGGKGVTNFSIAVNESWTTADGEKKQKTTWFRVAAWGRLAEITNQYLRKGRQVMVVGTIVGNDQGNPEVFTLADGSPASSFEVNASRVVFVGPRDGNGGGYDTDADPEYEDDIPF